MKRFISLTAVMATILALGACGGGTDTASDVECLDVPQEVLDTVASGSDNAGFTDRPVRPSRAIRMARTGWR